MPKTFDELLVEFKGFQKQLRDTNHATFVARQNTGSIQAKTTNDVIEQLSYYLKLVNQFVIAKLPNDIRNADKSFGKLTSDLNHFFSECDLRKLTFSPKELEDAYRQLMRNLLEYTDPMEEKLRQQAAELSPENGRDEMIGMLDKIFLFKSIMTEELKLRADRDSNNHQPPMQAPVSQPVQPPKKELPPANWNDVLRQINMPREAKSCLEIETEIEELKDGLRDAPLTRDNGVNIPADVFCKDLTEYLNNAFDLSSFANFPKEISAKEAFNELRKSLEQYAGQFSVLSYKFPSPDLQARYNQLVLDILWVVGHSVETILEADAGYRGKFDADEQFPETLKQLRLAKRSVEDDVQRQAADARESTEEVLDLHPKKADVPPLDNNVPLMGNTSHNIAIPRNNSPMSMYFTMSFNQAMSASYPIQPAIRRAGPPQQWETALDVLFRKMVTDQKTNRTSINISDNDMFFLRHKRESQPYQIQKDSPEANLLELLRSASEAVERWVADGKKCLDSIPRLDKQLEEWHQLQELCSSCQSASVGENETIWENPLVQKLREKREIAQGASLTALQSCVKNKILEIQKEKKSLQNTYLSLQNTTILHLNKARDLYECYQFDPSFDRHVRGLFQHIEYATLQMSAGWPISRLDALRSNIESRYESVHSRFFNNTDKLGKYWKVFEEIDRTDKVTKSLVDRAYKYAVDLKRECLDFNSFDRQYAALLLDMGAYMDIQTFRKNHDGRYPTDAELAHGFNGSFASVNADLFRHLAAEPKPVPLGRVIGPPQEEDFTLNGARWGISPDRPQEMDDAAKRIFDAEFKLGWLAKRIGHDSYQTLQKLLDLVKKFHDESQPDPDNVVEFFNFFRWFEKLTQNADQVDEPYAKLLLEIGAVADIQIFRALQKGAYPTADQLANGCDGPFSQINRELADSFSLQGTEWGIPPLSKLSKKGALEAIGKNVKFLTQSAAVKEELRDGLKELQTDLKTLLDGDPTLKMLDKIDQDIHELSYKEDIRNAYKIRNRYYWFLSQIRELSKAKRSAAYSAERVRVIRKLLGELQTDLKTLLDATQVPDDPLEKIADHMVYINKLLNDQRATMVVDSEILDMCSSLISQIKVEESEEEQDESQPVEHPVPQPPVVPVPQEDPQQPVQSQAQQFNYESLRQQVELLQGLWKQMELSPETLKKTYYEYEGNPAVQQKQAPPQVQAQPVPQAQAKQPDMMEQFLQGPVPDSLKPQWVVIKRFLDDNRMKGELKNELVRYFLLAKSLAKSMGGENPKANDGNVLDGQVYAAAARSFQKLLDMRGSLPRALRVEYDPLLKTIAAFMDTTIKDESLTFGTMRWESRRTVKNIKNTLGQNTRQSIMPTAKLSTMNPKTQLMNTGLPVHTTLTDLCRGCKTELISEASESDSAKAARILRELLASKDIKDDLKEQIKGLNGFAKQVCSNLKVTSMDRRRIRAHIRALIMDRPINVRKLEPKYEWLIRNILARMDDAIKRANPQDTNETFLAFYESYKKDRKGSKIKKTLALARQKGKNTTSFFAKPAIGNISCVYVPK